MGCSSSNQQAEGSSAFPRALPVDHPPHKEGAVNKTLDSPCPLRMPDAATDDRSRSSPRLTAGCGHCHLSHAMNHVSRVPPNTGISSAWRACRSGLVGKSSSPPQDLLAPACPVLVSCLALSKIDATRRADAPRCGGDSPPPATPVYAPWIFGPRRPLASPRDPGVGTRIAVLRRGGSKAAC
jgi:hypothetical protein